MGTDPKPQTFKEWFATREWPKVPKDLELAWPLLKTLIEGVGEAAWDAAQAALRQSSLCGVEGHWTIDWVLHFYNRGPNDPPGNNYACCACTRERKIRAEMEQEKAVAVAMARAESSLREAEWWVLLVPEEDATNAEARLAQLHTILEEAQHDAG